MTLLISVCVAALSLFFNQASCASPPPPGYSNYNTTKGTHATTPVIMGPGPQVSITYGTQESAYYWNSDFPLQSGLVSVYGYKSHDTYYNVTQDPNAKRGFMVKNMNDDNLVVATDKKKAVCGFRYTYNTGSGVSYRIDPRYAFTDRWYMTVDEKGGTQDELTYYRGRRSNQGNVVFSNNQTHAASFTYEARKDSGLTFDRIVLTIDNSTSVQPQYFIGLWVMVSKRMERCSP